MISIEELDVLTEAEVHHRLDRGDYCDPKDILFVKSWLRTAAKEREFLAKCERASISYARDARRMAIFGNALAAGALIVSIIALIKV